MRAVWDMMSDSKIWAMLGDVNRSIDEDVSRLMFIELLSRIKKLEEDNLALRTLLMEEDLVDSDFYDIVLKAVRDFLRQKDNEKSEESDFFARSGVSFPEWVSFKLTGRFKASGADIGLQ